MTPDQVRGPHLSRRHVLAAGAAVGAAAALTGGPAAAGTRGRAAAPPTPDGVAGRRRYTWRNDDRHQYAWTGAAITGDPRVYGRVYVATNGRGIIYGEPS